MQILCSRQPSNLAIWRRKRSQVLNCVLGTSELALAWWASAAVMFITPMDTRSIASISLVTATATLAAYLTAKVDPTASLVRSTNDTNTTQMDNTTMAMLMRRNDCRNSFSGTVLCSSSLCPFLSSSGDISVNNRRRDPIARVYSAERVAT